jgi:hypothetical protein
VAQSDCGSARRPRWCCYADARETRGSAQWSPCPQRAETVGTARPRCLLRSKVRAGELDPRVVNDHRRGPCHLRCDGWLRPSNASAPSGAPDGAQARCTRYPRGRGRDFLFSFWIARLEGSRGEAQIHTSLEIVHLSRRRGGEGEGGVRDEGKAEVWTMAAVRLPGCRGGDKRRRGGS